MQSGESQTDNPSYTLGYYPDEDSDACKLLAHEVIGKSGEWVQLGEWDLELIALEAKWLDPVAEEGEIILLPEDTLLFNCEKAAEAMITHIEELDPEKEEKLYVLPVRPGGIH